MSADQADQDGPVSQDENIDEIFREAEQAVDGVRSGKSDGGDPGHPDVELVDEAALATKLAEAEAEIVALKDRWLRSLADLENYKKRVKRDIDDAVHRAVQSLLGDFLPVGDNLDRAMSVAPSNPDEMMAPLLKGLDMVRAEFASALGKHGIKAIESVGKPFDPSVHDALQQMDSPDFAPGMVAMEYEKGYRRGDKLLRAARVIVAGPGSTGVGPDSTDTSEPSN
jgi:molecular chaperone GrpE